ncbi:helix-turn-helix domain-containing protein [Salmonella enterica subsp. houtenae]|uniref:Helix-turn-helix domain-containing protein n=1 Tax=Salmonella houtenae TaxID=59205 RepID=A0A5Y2SF05_SALHO|nr:helix-turn-helix domain-containing protein [Salmonella enterica subsp. houtenae]
MQCACQIMLLVLSRRGDAFLLPFRHPVSANFWVQVDVDFILIKHRMCSLLLSQRLLNDKPFFFIVRILDFQRWRCPAPDHIARELNIARSTVYKVLEDYKLTQ